MNLREAVQLKSETWLKNSNLKLTETGEGKFKDNRLVEEEEVCTGRCFKISVYLYMTWQKFLGSVSLLNGL